MAKDMHYNNQLREAITVELDSKQTVLIAAYSEYQKDVPDYKTALTESNLHMPMQVIDIALKKLQYERLIANYENRTADGRVGWNINNIMFTPEGIRYVEEQLSIEPKNTNAEKLRTLSNRASNFGWAVLTDFAAKVTAEILTKKY